MAAAEECHIADPVGLVCQQRLSVCVSYWGLVNGAIVHKKLGHDEDSTAAALTADPGPDARILQALGPDRFQKLLDNVYASDTGGLDDNANFALFVEKTCVENLRFIFLNGPYRP
jgi:hypothetical protein